MNRMNCTTTTTTDMIDHDQYHQPILFGFLLLAGILGLLSAVLILVFVLKNWFSIMKKSLHYHAIFLLNLISILYILFDLPFNLIYLRLGHHPYRSIPFCLWWYWFDFSILSMSLLLTAVASLQRHILVFYSHWFQYRQRRRFFHYLPFIISIIYPLVFYTVFIFFYPCDIYFNINHGWCAYPCYLDFMFPSMLDWTLNVVLPVLVILVANLALIVRVYRSMKRVHQHRSYTWKRQKKLTLQLTSISTIYMLVYVPTTIATLLPALTLQQFDHDVPETFHDFFYLICFVCPLQSVLCVFILPELMLAIQRRVSCFFQRTMFDRTVQVHPTVFIRSQNNVLQEQW